MNGRLWTEEEDDFICEKWGVCSVASISKTLGRTERAVKHRASAILKLGPAYAAGEYVTMSQIMLAMGFTRSPGQVAHLISMGMPVRNLKLINRHYRVIKLEDFWAWASENRHYLDFSRLEPLILGIEPDWVKAQRKKDAKVKAYRVRRPWSAIEKQQLAAMCRQGLSYMEISERLHRSEAAIIRRLEMLGIVELRPKARSKHNPWTPENDRALQQGIIDGDSWIEIAKAVDRNAKAVLGHCARLYGTTKADAIRKILLEEKKDA